MTTPEQRLIDDEHLRLLRIAYFIAAAWNAFWIFFPLIYIVMGIIFFFTVPQSAHAGDAPPRFVGCVIAAVAGGIAFVMGAMTVLKLLTAQAIGRRRSRTLCLVTAGISCFAIPYGAALGVATILVLMRPSVVETFAANQVPKEG